MNQKRGTLAQSGGSDVFVSGFERLELIGGGCVRIIAYVMKEIDGKTVRAEAEVSIVVPLSACADLAGKVLSAVGRPVFVDDNGKTVILQ